MRNLIDYLEGGEDLEAFLADFPVRNPREQAVAALEEAAEALEASCESS